MTGSQHTAGTNSSGVTGLYSATFALPSIEPSLYTKRDSIASALTEDGFVDFTTYFKSVDGTVAYHTGSLRMHKQDRRSGQFGSREPQVIVTNAETSYTQNDTVRFKLFGRDILAENLAPVKTPYSLPSTIFERIYYQVVDRVTGKVIIPYDTNNNSTKVSTDTEGMFFDFKMQSLQPGRSYSFDFYIRERGLSYLVQNRDTIFEVKA